MVHSGLIFILFCTANWLDVEGLNIEVGDNKVRRAQPLPLRALSHFHHCLSLFSGVTRGVRGGVRTAPGDTLQG